MAHIKDFIHFFRISTWPGSCSTPSGGIMYTVSFSGNSPNKNAVDMSDDRSFRFLLAAIDNNSLMVAGLATGLKVAL